MKFHNFTKKEKMAWWKSLTAEEQANYIFDKMIESGKTPNWDKIYTNVIKNGYYLK